MSSLVYANQFPLMPASISIVVPPYSKVGGLPAGLKQKEWVQIGMPLGQHWKVTLCKREGELAGTDSFEKTGVSFFFSCFRSSFAG